MALKKSTKFLIAFEVLLVVCVVSYFVVKEYNKVRYRTKQVKVISKHCKRFSEKNTIIILYKGGPSEEMEIDYKLCSELYKGQFVFLVYSKEDDKFILKKEI